MKRLFDFIFSIFGIIILLPVLIIVSLFIKFGSEGPIIYKQQRVGRKGFPFRLYKFRSMRVGSDKKGLLTLGDNDSRVTKTGLFIRKYKIDEFPQLFNVLKGDMSFVGPRPEVDKYVKLYTDEQKHILNVRPGITDLASIKYRDESEILISQDNPEEFYINVIMKDKLTININYLKNSNILTDIGVIIKTIKKIFN